MHILVAIKQVHDPNIRADLLKIGADGRSIVTPAGLSPVMNGYDANAVEAAVAIKEKRGAKVTVVSVGDTSAQNAIRRAIGMGADDGILIKGEVGLAVDHGAIAALLGAAAKRIGSVDLILCGKQASDTDAGVTPFLLAEALGMPAVSPIRAIEDIGPDSVTVLRMGDGMSQRIRLRLPAVLCVSNEINKPRPAPLKGVMAAKKAQIPSWSAEELGCGVPAPALILKSLRLSPPADGKAEMIAAADDQAAGRALAERLHREGLVP